MAEAMLQLQNVCAGYGPIDAVRGVSLNVYPGEIVTIIGANGAGKTSTLMCISSVLKVRSGTVRFEGKDVTNAPSHELVGKGLVQIPEGRKIFPRLTVSENLRLGAFLRHDAGIERDLEKVYSLFPVLKDRASQSGGTLSGGEQQMLAMGRALMSRPKLLLMDEPSMGIAPLLVEKIFAALVELNREGLTVLLVEQNAHLALQVAKRGYVLETGTVVIEDSAEALAANEKVREAYLGE
ncbi:MAG: ABC transporter ATP-binding protein [Bdellovibrionota bacterium]